LHQQQAHCAVLMLDIDHFKSVNDRYGHATGDAVLTHFGRLLRDCLREQDVLGRMGGEEFAALLPRATESEALAAAERVRQRLAATLIPVDSLLPPLHCTVSVGVTVEAMAPTCFDTLLGHADQALYLAKAQGRNRVVLWRRPS
ncbi:MAG: GGDEF domain-containing protein, partial [Stenotrophomonas sp.]